MREEEEERLDVELTGTCEAVRMGWETVQCQAEASAGAFCQSRQ